MSRKNGNDPGKGKKRSEKSQKKFNVLICMPAFNEERSIASTVLLCRDHSKNVTVVDDHSTDRTAEVSRMAGAEVVSHDVNRGYGGALRTIFGIAKRKEVDCLVIIDSDGQHDPKFIPHLIDPIRRREADLVIGSRFKSKEGRKKVPKYRMMGIQTITQVFNLGTSMSLTDAQSGFRAYSGEALRHIDVRSDNMDASMEILFDAYEGEFKVKEVPITVEYENVVGSSEAPFGHGYRVLNYTLKLIRERYPLKFFGGIGLFLILMIIPVVIYSREYHMPPSGILPVGGYFIVTILFILGYFLIFTGIMLKGINSIVNEKMASMGNNN